MQSLMASMSARVAAGPWFLSHSNAPFSWYNAHHLATRRRMISLAPLISSVSLGTAYWDRFTSALSTCAALTRVETASSIGENGISDVLPEGGKWLGGTMWAEGMRELPAVNTNELIIFAGGDCSLLRRTKACCLAVQLSDPPCLRNPKWRRVRCGRPV